MTSPIIDQELSTRPFDEDQEDRGNEQFLMQVQDEAPRELDAGSLLKYYKEEAARARAIASSSRQKGEEDGDEDNDTERSLSEDIYSLIYTANACSQAFLFALFIFLLQELLLLLILYDLVDLRNYDSENPLRLPAGVPMRVNVAQAISVILIVATILEDSGDLTSGLFLLIEGYHPTILQKNPHATCLKWFCAGLFQTVAGLSMTVVLFILVMQSTTVIGLALNFAALSFIYEIDNITFAMGKLGFLSETIKSACQHVAEHRVPIAHRKHQKFSRPILVVLMSVSLFIPYGFLVHSQWDSQFLCSRVFVQFGDEVVPQLAYFTGHFDLQQRNDEFLGGLRSRLDDRVYYEDSTNALRLAYCQRDEAWTISAVNISDHCNYVYKSSTTQTFDVTAIAGSQWYGWSFPKQRLIPVAGFYLRCDDCVGGERGNCHPHNGVCLNNQCECLDARMGVHCDNKLPLCEKIRVDTRTNPLPYEEGLLFSDNYQVLRNAERLVEIQFKPVYVTHYYGSLTNVTYRKSDFMFFNGRRWEIVRAVDGNNRRKLGTKRKPEMRPWEKQQRKEGQAQRSLLSDKDAAPIAFETPKALELLFFEIALVEREMQSAHDVTGESNNIFANGTASSTILDDDDSFASIPGNIFSYRPFFFSQPVDPLSKSDKLTPAGLDWYQATRDDSLEEWYPDESWSLGTIFLCATCDPISNHCMNAGECNTNTGVCECLKENGGSMCERTLSCHESGGCQNNGTCEEWREYCTCDRPFYGSLCQYADLASLVEYPIDI